MFAFGKAHIGDTFYRVGHPVEPMPGFKPARAMVRAPVASACISTADVHPFVKVYAGIYPVDNNDFLKLEESIRRVSSRSASQLA